MDKETEINPNSDDKDFGFPFAKVEPLDNPSHIEVNSTLVEENHKVVLESKETSAEPKINRVLIPFEPKEKPEEIKKNRISFLLTLVILILVVMSSMAYFLYYLPNQKELAETIPVTVDKKELPQMTPEIKVVEVPESEVDSLSIELTETTPSVSPTAPSVTSSGGNLIVVNTKEDISYYHLVIGSLPNERIAREEAQVFLENGKDIWLIFPSGDTKNYRLSVGKYSSFKAAAEALATAKADFNESTWILKY